MGDPRGSGEVLWFSEHKGYGYLVDATGTAVYVDHTAIVGEGFRSLAPGTRVTFRRSDDGRGPVAVEVEEAAARA